MAVLHHQLVSFVLRALLFEFFKSVLKRGDAFRDDALLLFREFRVVHHEIHRRRRRRRRLRFFVFVFFHRGCVLVVVFFLAKGLVLFSALRLRFKFQILRDDDAWRRRRRRFESTPQRSGGGGLHQRRGLRRLLAAIIIRSTRRVRVVLEQMVVWHFAGGGGFGRTTTTVLVVRGPFRRQSVTHFWASSCEAKSFLSESLCQSRFVGRCD